MCPVSAASRLLSALGRVLRPRTATRAPALAAPVDARTVAAEPRRVRDVVLAYAPDRDGEPDAGEIVWTWVPYEEGDGRGKDRPVLVIARHGADRVYAVRLTSSPHPRDPDYLALGPGEWDAAGRPSWVDLAHLYSVHVRGMRREAAALDRRRFGAVAGALRTRYGWREEGGQRVSART